MVSQLSRRTTSYVSSVDVSFGLKIGILLLAFLIAERGISHLAQLPSESYQEPSILVALVKQTRGAVLWIVLTLVLLLWRVPSLRANWLVLPQGRLVRVIVVTCVAILAWVYSTYSINLYFNQHHVDARFALVLLAFLTSWRPVFVPVFLLVAVAIIHQFHFPLGGDSVAEQFLLVRILLVCWLGFCLHAVWPDSERSEATLFLVFIVIAAGYWTCGLGKLRLNWISLGHLNHLLHATYANGWLGFLSAEQIARLSGLVAKFDWPMRIMVLTFEVGALVFLWRRWTIMVLLIGWLLFHLGVLLMSGIFCWKWIVLELAILVFLIRNRETTQFSFFRPSVFVLSFMLIGAGKWVFRPVNLSWFDSPLSYTFRFEAETAGGQRYSLPPRFFAPYSHQFTLGAFRHLSEEPMIPVVWGQCLIEILREDC